MQSLLLKKGLIIGIIVLLIVIAVLPASSNISVSKNSLQKQKNTTGMSSTRSIDDVDWWPMFHHDLQSTGFTTSSGPSSKKVLWTVGDWDYSWDAPQRCSPVIVNNTVYIGACDPSYPLEAVDNKNLKSLIKKDIPFINCFWQDHNKLSSSLWYEAIVYAYDTDTGNEKWRTYLPEQHYIGGAPAVENDRVYITSNYDTFNPDGLGFLFCLDAISGEILWNFSLYQRYISPIVDNGRVFVPGWIIDEDTTFYAKLFCLDAISGVEIYNTTLGNGTTVDAPAMYNNWIYISFYDSDENVYLCCIDADNGDIIWCKDIDGDAGCCSPVITDDKVIISTAYVYSEEEVSGKLWCLDTETGEEIWSYYTEGLCNGWSTPAFAYNNVYVALTDHALETIGEGEIHCLDALSGEVLWEKYLGYWLASSPAIADGKIYVNSMDWWGQDGFAFDSYTHCIDAFSGDNIWSYWLLSGIQTSPAIADGSLYVASPGFFFKFDDSAPNNYPPEVEISGETNVDPGVEYTYTIVANDPEDSLVYVVYTTSDEPDTYTSYTCQSGEIEEISRVWEKGINNTICARSQDSNYAWSDWEVLEITVPRNKKLAINSFMEFLEQFPLLKKFLFLRIK